jgi:signal peptidase I
VTDETLDDSPSEGSETSGIAGSDPGWTDDLLARARERSEADMDESSASAMPVDESVVRSGPAPPVIEETQLDGSDGAGLPTAAERPNFLTRADLESQSGTVSAVTDETFVIPTLPAKVDQGGPESVDLGIPDRRVGGRRAMLEWGSVVAGALVLAILVRTFLFGAYYIPSPSMEPTLSIGDRIVVNKVSYRLHDVNRGDLVVFTPTGTAAAEGIDDLIKRVIGLPGETVTVADGRVLIDGGMLIEPYLADPFSTDDLQTVPWCLDGGMAKCTVPADHVFVLGDNRANSRDSRFFGPVPIDSIAGRAFARFWPLGSLDRL